MPSYILSNIIHDKIQKEDHVKQMTLVFAQSIDLLRDLVGTIHSHLPIYAEGKEIPTSFSINETQYHISLIELGKYGGTIKIMKEQEQCPIGHFLAQLITNNAYDLYFAKYQGFIDMLPSRFHFLSTLKEQLMVNCNALSMLDTERLFSLGLPFDDLLGNDVNTMYDKVHSFRDFFDLSLYEGEDRFSFFKSSFITVGFHLFFKLNAYRLSSFLSSERDLVNHDLIFTPNIVLGNSQIKTLPIEWVKSHRLFSQYFEPDDVNTYSYSVKRYYYPYDYPYFAPLAGRNEGRGLEGFAEYGGNRAYYSYPMYMIMYVTGGSVNYIPHVEIGFVSDLGDNKDNTRLMWDISMNNVKKNQPISMRVQDDLLKYHRVAEIYFHSYPLHPFIGRTSGSVFQYLLARSGKFPQYMHHNLPLFPLEIYDLEHLYGDEQYYPYLFGVSDRNDSDTLLLKIKSMIEKYHSDPAAYPALQKESELLAKIHSKIGSFFFNSYTMYLETIKDGTSSYDHRPKTPRPITKKLIYKKGLRELDYLINERIFGVASLLIEILLHDHAKYNQAPEQTTLLDDPLEYRNPKKIMKEINDYSAEWYIFRHIYEYNFKKNTKSSDSSIRKNYKHLFQSSGHGLIVLIEDEEHFNVHKLSTCVFLKQEIEALHQLLPDINFRLDETRKEILIDSRFIRADMINVLKEFELKCERIWKDRAIQAHEYYKTQILEN